MVPVSNVSTERSNHKRVNTDIPAEPIKRIPFTSSDEPMEVSSNSIHSSNAAVPIKSTYLLSH